MSIINTIEKEQFKTNLVPFEVGDSVSVHTRVIEGDKERIQKYAGKGLRSGLIAVVLISDLPPDDEKTSWAHPPP